MNPWQRGQFSLGGATRNPLIATGVCRLQIWRNRTLKVYSRPGEAKEQFVECCQDLADDEADREAEKLKDRYHGRRSGSGLGAEVQRLWRAHEFTARQSHAIPHPVRSGGRRLSFVVFLFFWLIAFMILKDQVPQLDDWYSKIVNEADW